MIHRANSMMALGWVFAFVAFVATWGPIDHTGYVAQDVSPPHYVGPESILVKAGEPLMVDLSLYWENAHEYIVAASPEITVEQDKNRLVIFSPDFVGETNITISAKSANVWGSVNVPVLVFHKLSDDRVRAHNLPREISLESYGNHLSSVEEA